MKETIDSSFAWEEGAGKETFHLVRRTEASKGPEAQYNPAESAGLTFSWNDRAARIDIQSIVNCESAYFAYRNGGISMVSVSRPSIAGTSINTEVRWEIPENSSASIGSVDARTRFERLSNKITNGLASPKSTFSEKVPTLVRSSPKFIPA